VKATLAGIASRLQTVFVTLPDQAAAKAGLIQRKRKFTPIAFALGLTLAWLQRPGASYARLLGFLAAAGVTVSASALCQRFTPELAEFFLELLRQATRLALQPLPAHLPLLGRFTAVLIHDSTTVGLPAALATVWPGCGGDGGTASLKISACLELVSGSLDLSLEPGKQHDNESPLLMRTPAKGSLVINDLGYFDLGRLAEWSAAGVFWITRASANISLTDDGEYQTLRNYLEALLREKCVRVETWLSVGTGDLSCRLIAIRCPAEVEARRRQKLYQRCQKRGETPKRAALLLCGWTVFLTNVPQGMLTWREVWTVYRLRWQVELLFKRWKSLGGLGHSVGTKQDRLVVEVYAKLLGALMRQWLTMTTGRGWRLGCSLYKMESVIQDWGLALLRAVGNFGELVRLLADLGEVLRNTPGVDRRTRRPSAFETLEDPNDACLYQSA
jgi:Transposase DDE domain